MTRVGILGVGLYLPPEIRTNDWWAPEIVASWSEARARRRPKVPDPLTLDAQRVLAAMAEQRRDEFLGTHERHLMPATMTLQDMEAAAATTALERAGIPRSSIGLLLTNRVVPDFLLGNPACDLHARLGLPHECTATQVDAAAHSFLVQLGFAEAMVLAGKVEYALLVQSCAPSRLVSWTDVTAPLFGDAATAVVVGRVSDTRGVLASVNFTDGRYPKTVIAAVPGGTWYDAGTPTVHESDTDQLFDLMLQTPTVCSEAIEAVLTRAQRTTSDVDALIMHQGTPWLRDVIRDRSGLTHAHTVDMFRDTAYIFASTMPAALARLVESAKLASDQLVVFVGGGTGHIYGATALVWGS